MELYFNAHGEGCTPSAPCKICQLRDLMTIATSKPGLFGLFTKTVDASSFSIDEHKPGCTPRKPCTNCKAMVFLRSNLNWASVDALIPGPQEKPGDSDATFPSLEVLELTERTMKALEKAKVTTIEEIIQKTETDLLRIPRLGRFSVDRIVDRLANYGLKLKDD